MLSGLLTLLQPSAFTAIWPQAERYTTGALQAQRRDTPKSFSHLPSVQIQKIPLLVIRLLPSLSYTGVTWSGAGRAKNMTG